MYEGGPCVICEGGPCVIYEGGPCDICEGGPCVICEGVACVICEGGPCDICEGGPCVIYEGGPCDICEGGPCVICEGVACFMPYIMLFTILTAHAQYTSCCHKHIYLLSDTFDSGHFIHDSNMKHARTSISSSTSEPECVYPNG